MTALCILLAVALVLVAGAAIVREHTHRIIVADLLDRVMARSYGEYVAAHPSANVPRPRSRSPLPDEALAAREAQRHLARSGG